MVMQDNHVLAVHLFNHSFEAKDDERKDDERLYDFSRLNVYFFCGLTFPSFVFYLALFSDSYQTGKFVFCARKTFFAIKFARMKKPSSHLLPI